MNNLKQGDLVHIVDLDPSDEYHFLADILIGAKAQITYLPDAYHTPDKPDYRPMRLKILQTIPFEERKIPYGFVMLFVSIKVEKINDAKSG